MWKSRLFCFLLLALSFGVNAADYAARWSISRNTAFSSELEHMPTELWLDLDIGAFAIAAHGILKFGQESSPVAGTCLFNTSGGITCSIDNSIVFGYSLPASSLAFFTTDSLSGPAYFYYNDNYTYALNVNFLGLGVP